MTFDRRRSELEARSSAPPRFTQQATMINLLNLTHTTENFATGRLESPPYHFGNTPSPLQPPGKECGHFAKSRVVTVPPPV
jgi:hypothetical protein